MIPLPLKVIVEVLALNVMFVVVDICQLVPVPAIVILAAPKVKVRVFEFEELNNPQITVCPLTSKVPAVSVVVAVACCCIPPVNFQLPPAPLKVTVPTNLLLKSTSCAVLEVEIKLIIEVVADPADQPVPESILNAIFDAPAVPSPMLIVVEEGRDKVPVNPVQLIDRATVEFDKVTVPVERLVKKTSSAAVGTDAPPAPPEVVAHLVPAVASHVADPPTQYLLAIFF